MDIGKLIGQAKEAGFKGFCEEFKSQYVALTPKGKKIFWGAVAGVVVLIIVCGSGSGEPEKSDYDRMKADVSEACKQAKGLVNGELKESAEMLEKGSNDLKKGLDGLKKAGISF